ncbi:MAG TPA: hypothetical protein VM146_16715 [Steroidobacteraceae bacterium]|nr:hypothetical protein [Steroidobacteraceae bacterium]
MRRKSRYRAAGMLSVLAIGTAVAQQVSDADASRVRAAIVIATFDELEARCARGDGFSVEHRQEIDRWVSANGIAKLRAHLDGAGLTAPLREQVRAGSAQVIRQVAAAANPCLAAVSVTRTNDARFADKLPQLLAGSTDERALTGTMELTLPTPKIPAAEAKRNAYATRAAAATATRLAADIEGFGFDSCTRVGYGGMVMFVPCPVVLFKDGGALTDVEGLNHPRGIAAHRAAKPDQWTQWRRDGERVQLRKSQGWDNITYTAVYSTLPASFRLDGRYHSMSGGGNTAMGGGQAVAAWSDYLFGPDGSVQRGGGAAATSTGNGADVTVGSNAAHRRGRYRIDGLILAIDYEDGSQERRVIIADPKDQGRGTMWLDGEGYVYQK